ncbi:MAG: META domain-containing protein [Gemmatimonadales bacterium]
MRTRSLTSMVLAAALASGCHSAQEDGATNPPAPLADSTRVSLAGPEWTLVELDGRPIEPEAASRPPNLHFDAEAGRVTGFAGCNRLGGSYQAAASGDSLKFGPLVTTKMACEPGMELETGFLAALEATRAYRVSERGLELLGDGGPRARFKGRVVPP